MNNSNPQDGKPGTTDQSPRWEGPEENRPRGYLPALDNPDEDRDAAGHNLQDPDRQTLSDAFTMPEGGAENTDALPEFTDPANSNATGSPVAPDAPDYPKPPVDTQYAGHPEFSQAAANNKPPRGLGNSESVEDVDEETRHSEGVNPKHPSPQQTSGAGPALAKHSKDT